MGVKKQVIVKEIALRQEPLYDSKTVPVNLKFGDCISGVIVSENENDFSYLQTRVNQVDGYVPLEYLVDEDIVLGNSLKRALRLPLDFIPEKLELLSPQWTASIRPLALTRETIDQFNRLVEKAMHEKIDLKVINGYQGIIEQARLYKQEYESLFKQKLIEKPTCSIYHLGTVLDITTSEIDHRLHPTFFLTKAYQWLAENANEFNFTLRHPPSSFLKANHYFKPWQLQLIHNDEQLHSPQLDLSNYHFISLKKSLLFYMLSHRPGPFKFYFVHDNEHTARKVARYAVNHYLGTLYETINGGQRELEIMIQGHLVKYDPNRMFTKKGLSLDLKNHNPQYPAWILKVAFDEITTIRYELLKVFSISKTDYFIALHTNNKQSVLSMDYFLSSELSNSFLLSSNSEYNPKNFFYTISADAFRYFSSRNYNVVFQKESDKIDDGSLSIWMAKRNYNYIAIEVEEGHDSVQKKMLASAVQFFLSPTK